MEQNKIYKATTKLTWWQKLAQVYWFNPKSWLLDEFIIEGDLVTIKCHKGEPLTAPLSELKVRYQIDDYDRKEYYFTHNEKKVHFKEIGYMLPDEEWEEIFEFLSKAPNFDKTKANKILSIIKPILDFFK